MSGTFQKLKGVISNLDYRQLYMNGCIDVIVVEQPNGSYKCTPFHVRFGQLAGRQCSIDIYINDQPTQVRMSLDKQGSAYFEKEVSTGYQSDDVQSAHFNVIKYADFELMEKKNATWFQSLKFWQRDKKSQPSKKKSSETLSSPRNEVQMSICGANTQEFDQQLIQFQLFVQSPLDILENPQLMFRINGEIVDKQMGIAQLICKAAFQQELPKPVPQISIERIFETRAKSSERFRKSSEESQSTYTNTKRKSKTPKLILKPSSAVLRQLNLKHGRNKITYKIVNDKRELNGTIFLFTQKTKLIISDIDGTITKSDLLGQLIPKLGSEWNHEGVAQLYQNIKKMGYQMMYLTARAIGQADQTKEFIYNLKQDDLTLPFGPVLTSPDSLFPAFKREIIDGTPEQFKISALKEIRNMFLEECPFFCGFGNRMTDATAYLAVNVDVARIYIIDTDSRIHVYNSSNTTSYVEMNKNLNLYFPPLQEEEFLDQNFWRIPLPDFDINNY